jgi:hypothetical protein
MMLDSPADQNQWSGPTRPLPANFVETDTPEISVPELLARVQEEVARRRKADFSLRNSPENGPGSYLGTGRRSRSNLDWGIITANLGIAEKNALVGKHVPKMKRFPGPIRMVARLLASGFLYVLRMITNPQREFNHAILIALQALHDGIRQLEKAHQHALDDLKDRQLEEIRKALQDQQRRLDVLLDEVRRKAG